MSQAGPLDVLASHPEIPTSFPTNSGTAVPIANVLEILGNGSIFTTGAANIVTIELTGLTDHNVLLGQGTTTIGLAAPSATVGVPLVSQGAAADPAFGTATVPGGGTGDTSFTAYAPICGGTTSTGNLQSASTGIATAGFVLTSNGAGALPSFQAGGGGGSGITTIDGDTGSVTGTTVSIISDIASNFCGSTVLFSATSPTVLSLNVSDASSNTIIGGSAGNTSISGSGNTGFGFNCIPVATTGSVNTCAGFQCLKVLDTGNFNSAYGAQSGYQLISGSNNSYFGYKSGFTSDGSDNISIGYQSSIGYSSTESSNIIIGNSGTNGDNNTIRIGTDGSGAGQQNLCYVAGIIGNTLTSPDFVGIDSATGQLGVIPGPSAKASFYAYLSSTASNVTGDGTVYTVICDTVLVNQTSSYNNATGIFTAPVDGLYTFSANVALTGIGVAHTNGTIIFLINGNSVYTAINNPALINSGGVLAFNATTGPYPMTAGQTAQFNAAITGSTKTVNVFGLSAPNIFTWFGGYQIY